MARTITASSSILVTRAADWLMEQALNDAELEVTVRGACERLRAAGIPLARAQFSFAVLHPLYGAVGFTWRKTEGLKVEGYLHNTNDVGSDRFRQSPYYHLVHNGLSHLRRRLDTGDKAEFPIFEDLRKEGLTDYLAFVSSFAAGRAQGMLGSWATDQAGGFAEAEIEHLLDVQGALAVASKMAMRTGLAKSVLTTYIGGKAGERVLSGQIKRGDGETIRAAIVWGDLRGSTQMAETLGRQAYIDNLDTFFDATAGAVADAGGDILSFIGDGFLAIFPCGRNHKESQEACRLALSASLESERRMSDVNGERRRGGDPELGYGVGLHIGNVMFGNVGLADRLSFSVFGSAVNEASRLEALTKSYKTPIVASDAFKDYCGGAWEQLGTERLRGVAKPVAIFRPAPGDGAWRPAAIAKRNVARGLTDAENVVLLHRDQPA